MDLDELINATKVVNLFFEDFITKLPCYTDSPQSLCANCLLEMIRGTGRTIADLLEKEHSKDAQILLRTQLERFIKLKKICDDPDFAIQFIWQTQRLRLKFIEFAKGNGEEFLNNPHYSGLKDIVTDAEVDSLRKEVASYPRTPEIWLLAKQTGLLEDYYSTAYRIFSEVAHCESSELDDCFYLEDKEIVLSAYGSRRTEDVVPALKLSNHIILESVSIVSQIKEIDISEKYIELRELLGSKP